MLSDKSQSGSKKNDASFDLVKQRSSAFNGQSSGATIGRVHTASGVSMYRWRRSSLGMFSWSLVTNYHIYSFTMYETLKKEKIDYITCTFLVKVVTHCLNLTL